jgi:hypothetical protein
MNTKNVVYTSAKKCLLSSPVFKSRLRLDKKPEKDALLGLDIQITIYLTSETSVLKAHE